MIMMRTGIPSQVIVVFYMLIFRTAMYRAKTEVKLTRPVITPVERSLLYVLACGWQERGTVLNFPLC